MTELKKALRSLPFFAVRIGKVTTCERRTKQRRDFIERRQAGREPLLASDALVLISPP
jgi:hypothetical protein